MAPLKKSTPRNTYYKRSDVKVNRLEGEFKKKKSKKTVPMGFKGLAVTREARLEKLVLGETSGLFKEPEETSVKVTTILKAKKLEAKPAWDDPDTSEIPGNRVKTFQTLTGNPQWAKLDRKRRSSSSDEEDDEVGRHAGNLLSRSAIKHGTLTKGTLEYKRNLDLNSDSEHGGMIKAVEFHPASTVALVADTSGNVALYEVNGRTNPKLQSLKFDKFPINCAKFAVNGTDFLVGSVHKYMYCYDMESGTHTKINTPKKAITNFKNFKVSPDGRLIAVVGRFGEIHLLTAQTKEVVSTLKMNCEATAIAFNSKGTRLYSHGDESEVYVWDTNSRTCIERFLDDGCVSGTSLASSSQYIATGSTSGAVNIYSAGASMRSPVKTLLNLVTPITGLEFNSSEEILAISSHHTPNAMRLVHLPSFTVFANFPGRFGERDNASSLRLTQCMTFSPNGGYLAIGDNRSQVALFRVKHYGNY